MSNRIFRGPLLLVIVAVAAILAYRFLPVDGLIDSYRASDEQSRVDERTAPPAPATVAPAPRPPVAQQDVVSTAEVAATAEAPVAVATEPREVGMVKPAAEPEMPAAKPAVPPVQTPPQVAVAPGPIEPAAAARPQPEPKARPAPKPKPKPLPEPVQKPVPKEEPVVAAASARAVVPAQPVVPNLRVFAQADVNDRAGLGNLTAGRYSALLKKELAAVATDYLGSGAVQSGDPNRTFRDQLAAGREGRDRLCREAGARRLLLADVVINAAGFSTVDSAYWPEVKFTAINCNDGRFHKSPKKRLEPSNMDTFGFQQQFNQHSQDFIARQGYFLKP